MRWGAGVLAVMVTLVAFVGVAAAGPPVVSAGLDQNVVLGDTVYLDGGGTHVPDGDLASLEWAIETPDGRTITPDCVDCEFTSFQPTQTGQYSVTLTARSESGVERSDTLYVSVNAASGGGGVAPADDGGSDGGGGGSSASAGSGGGDNDGCWLEHEGDGGGPMDQTVCSNIGSVAQFNVNQEGDAITHVIFENQGFADEYSEYERLDNGNLRVPIRFVEHQTVELNEQAENSNSQPPNRRFSGGGNTSPPSDETGKSIDKNEDMNLDTCTSVPASFCQ